MTVVPHSSRAPCARRPSGPRARSRRRSVVGGLLLSDERREDLGELEHASRFVRPAGAYRLGELDELAAENGAGQLPRNVESARGEIDCLARPLTHVDPRGIA